jgi:hypothetical protein
METCFFAVRAGKEVGGKGKVFASLTGSSGSGAVVMGQSVFFESRIRISLRRTKIGGVCCSAKKKR